MIGFYKFEAEESREEANETVEAIVCCKRRGKRKRKRRWSISMMIGPVSSDFLWSATQLENFQNLYKI